MRLLGLLLLSLLVVACGDEFATVEPDNPTKAADGLVFTRADGSSYELQNATAICFDARGKPGVQVLRLTAPAAREADAIFRVEVVPGTTGTFRLPVKLRDPGAGPSDVTVTAVDPHRHVRVSGAVRTARGTITISESTCDPEPRLSLTIDARLAGTKSGARVRVVGGMASMFG